MTEQSLPHSCPEPAVLAAYIEGLLGDMERQQVERHVANCLECPVVVGATVQDLAELQEEEPDDRPQSHPRRLIAAAIVTVCIGAAVWQGIRARDPMQQLRAIASTAETRSVEGYLSGFPHANFDTRRTGAMQGANIRLRALEERLSSDPMRLHERGVAALLIGRHGDAVNLLVEASQKTPDDAAVWNDLAAAQLAKASLDDRAAATFALKAANRAIALAPSSAAAHYNRAVALEHLDLHAEAQRAFHKALDYERSKAWQNEIQGRLENLSRQQ